MSGHSNGDEPLHERVSALADTAAKATRVAAAVGVVGAGVAAPTGLSAVAVSVGLVSAPLVVTAAPLLLGVASTAAAISAAASLYSRWQRRKARADSRDVSVEVPLTSGQEPDVSASCGRVPDSCHPTADR